MLVLEALSAPTTAAPGGAVPATEIVVALDDEERRKCGQRRFRNRSIRSAHAGVLAVKYETGSVGAGRMHPAQLRALAPPGMTFAYDAMAEVLNLRYVDLRQREEIRTILAAGSVPISAGSVSNLSRLGLACLEQVHEAAAENLGDHYRREAFILHMDGTHEGGQWCHFVVREGTGGHVLLARKIRSEHSEDIGEMLQRVRELFGRPDAVVSDMSAAIRKAAEGVLPDVPHLLCHFHFLKAVGIAVLGPDHDALGYGVKRTRSELKKLRRDCVAELRKGDRRQTWVISLIDRVNEYAGGLSGEGFPFDLPNLEYVRRCGEVLARVESLPVFRPDRATGAAAVGHLVGLRTVLRDHTRAGTGTARIERRAELFLELREILHPVTGDTRAPLNWGRIEDPARMADIEEGIEAFRDKARRMNARKSLSAGERKMWRSLHKTLKAHADHLDPLLEVRGRHYILPRTNNLSETGFRDMKRKQRRTTGNGDLKRQLDHMPAQVFYTENLADPVYREIAFGGRAMHECFADADWETVKTAVEEMKSPPRIGAVDHALINSDDFFDTVRAALAPGADAEAPKAVEDRILTP